MNEPCDRTDAHDAHRYSLPGHFMCNFDCPGIECGFGSECLCKEPLAK